jgi:hypothetical protein
MEPTPLVLVMGIPMVCLKFDNSALISKCGVFDYNDVLVDFRYDFKGTFELALMF